MVDAISTGSRISPLTMLRRHSVSAFVLTTALAALVVVIDALRSLGVSRIWDDAFMFERYAYNLLREGRIAWNPGGEPTYGLTSPAFLAVVGPLVAILGERPAHVATLASALSGFLFLALLGLLVLRYTDAPRVPSWMALMLVTCCLAVSNTTFHFGTGMDTTFSLAFATMHLIVAHRAARRPGARTALVLGVVGGLAYLVRPELVLQALLLPASMLALSEDRAARRCGGLALAVTLTVLLLVLGACTAYFDSPLPLPFYAKSTGLYGPGMEAAFRGFSTKELLAFVARYWPLFLIVLLDLPNHVRRGPASPSPVERGALIATVLLISVSLATGPACYGVLEPLLPAGRPRSRLPHSDDPRPLAPDARRRTTACRVEDVRRPRVGGAGARLVAPRPCYFFGREGPREQTARRRVLRARPLGAHAHGMAEHVLVSAGSLRVVARRPRDRDHRSGSARCPRAEKDHRRPRGSQR